ncbi:MAG: sodium/panthothenate symporter [Methanomassiliicoccales archaeon PtaU1.Bin124]|nr:MAG: sodium/panthothenate symporter [Methanomassiliicoccales archaeon PtaU1.Bin124]
MVDTGLVVGATIVYIGIVVVLGYLGWKKTKSGKDFLLAGQNVSPWIIGLSYGSTFISTSAIVGFGGFAGNYGMGIIWLAALNILVGLLLAFVYFGKKVRRLGKKLKAQTFPELLGKAYGSRFIRWFMAIVILIGMPLYTWAVLISGSLLMSPTLGISVNDALIILTLITAAYVIFGGLRAVMYTDALQGALMIFGMIAIMVITISLIGGVDHGNQSLTDMASLHPTGITSTGNYNGMNGWTAMPAAFSDNWIILVGTIIIPVGIGVLAQPQLAVRFMTAKDSKTLNRSIPFGGVFLLTTVGFAYILGSWTNVYFYDKLTQISIVAAKSQGNIIPAFINMAMPEWVVVIFMLTLVAAAMSTLSSLFHVMGSAAGYDIWRSLKMTKLLPERMRGEDESGKALNITRGATLVFVMVSFLMAYFLPSSGGFIPIATSMFFGICASAFLPLYIHMLWSKDPSKKAAEWSLAVGTIVWLFTALFCCKTDGAVLGICKAIFGTDTLLSGQLAVLDPILYALPLSTLTFIIVWFYDKKMVKAAA